MFQSASPEPREHGNGIRMSDMLTKTAEILESETIYRTALASNINAFHQALGAERKNVDLQDRVTQLEERLRILEAQLLGKLEMKVA